MSNSPVPALPLDSAARKDIPIVTGCLDYFSAALAAVAELSRIGNEKHNPGQPLHHSRGKSNDHADCIGRHLTDRGTSYVEHINGQPVVLRHSTALAWRALALLQEELEAAGAPLARGAVAAVVGPPVVSQSGGVERIEHKVHPALAPEPRDANGAPILHPDERPIDVSEGTYDYSP